MKKNLAPDCKCGAAVVCYANNVNTEKLVCVFYLRLRKKKLKKFFVGFILKKKERKL